MSALTQSRDTIERVPAARRFVAGAVIYCGALVAVNAEGKAVPASDTAGLTVVGRAEHSAVTDEAILVRRGCFAYDGTGITRADLGASVYVADDQTVSKTGGSNSIVAGRVFDVDEDGIWIICG